MALIVQKYGGTSVGTIERIHRVADRVAHTQREGHQVVVVLSAMSGETDRLLKLAHEVTAVPDERELDMLLSTGERITIALLSMELRGRGLNARSFTGRQVGIITDSAHTKARIARVTADRIKDALKQGVIPVVAGFQGINEQSDVTTLGRGGSDLSAVALAAALKAERCIIFTDVDGVYTADPNIVPAARRIDKISYEEMLEMASLGAKVLQTRSVEFAAKFTVPVEVNSSFKEGKGTLVTKEDADMDAAAIAGVTGDRNQAKI
ncbi:MAG: aspartate kinase, partial [Nitrospira sp.]